MSKSRSQAGYIRLATLILGFIIPLLILGPAGSAVAGNWNPGNQLITAVSYDLRFRTVKNNVLHEISCSASLKGTTAAIAEEWMATLRLDPATCQRLEAGHPRTLARVRNNPLEVVSLGANSARLVLGGGTEIEAEVLANCVIRITAQGITGNYTPRTNGSDMASIWYLTNKPVSIIQPVSECAAGGGVNTTGEFSGVFGMTNLQNVPIKAV